MDAHDYTLLLRSLDAPLTDREQERLRLLLSVSAEARNALQQYRALRGTVATHASAGFAPGFADRVLERVDAERTRPAAGLRLVVSSRSALWAAAAAVALLVVTSFFWLFRPTVVSAPYGLTEALTLPDGSHVELASGSTLRYHWLGRSEARHVTLTGEAFFDVAHDADRPFVVEAFNADVTVLGTRFNVAAWPDDLRPETIVTLESGRVRVDPRPSLSTDTDRPEAPEALRAQAVSDAVVLQPGEAAVVHAGARLLPADSVSLARMLAWRSGGFFVSDRPLASVLDQVERRFDVEIEVTADLARRRVSYLNPDPPSAAAVLADLCQALDLRYRRTADGFDVFAP